MDLLPILDRLCYRYPSPLVDVILEHEPGRRLKAVKNVSINEDYFQGHFPGQPLMPGVLMIETMAQVAAVRAMPAPVVRARGSRLWARLARGSHSIQASSQEIR